MCLHEQYHTWEDLEACGLTIQELLNRRVNICSMCGADISNLYLCVKYDSTDLLRYRETPKHQNKVRRRVFKGINKLLKL